MRGDAQAAVAEVVQLQVRQRAGKGLLDLRCQKVGCLSGCAVGCQRGQDANGERMAGVTTALDRAAQILHACMPVLSLRSSNVRTIRHSAKSGLLIRGTVQSQMLAMQRVHAAASTLSRISLSTK